MLCFQNLVIQVMLVTKCLLRNSHLPKLWSMLESEKQWNEDSLAISSMDLRSGVLCRSA